MTIAGWKTANGKANQPVDVATGTALWNLGLFSLVSLWACELAGRVGNLPVLTASWYKKPEPTFADCLAAVRRVLWAEEAVSPIMWRSDCPTWRSRPRAAEKPTPLAERLAILVSWAA